LDIADKRSCADREHVLCAESVAKAGHRDVRCGVSTVR
jgi:hypothetical protein